MQEKFLDWQCQSRMNAFRTQGGRPNTSMTPYLLDDKGNEYAQIIVVLVENDCEETTRLFEYNFKKHMILPKDTTRLISFCHLSSS
ncbi:MAG: hypothetical protein CM15mP70_15210 [Pelagibacteraceae bacterium]|nr:MAG: hypothetical protein CM15mP70_15210 [Pelagibacteraceae bacterium]